MINGPRACFSNAFSSTLSSVCRLSEEGLSVDMVGRMRLFSLICLFESLSLLDELEGLIGVNSFDMV